MTADGGLAAWAEASGRRRAEGHERGALRFAFYGRVPTEDWQDPVMSRARQREQAEAPARGHGAIVVEFFDEGESRSVAWGRRPQAAALVALLADARRGWDAIVVGEYERAFYGSQYASMAPLFEHYGTSYPPPSSRLRLSTSLSSHSSCAPAPPPWMNRTCRVDVMAIPLPAGAARNSQRLHRILAVPPFHDRQGGIDGCTRPIPDGPSEEHA
jgi:hypothetical protein